MNGTYALIARAATVLWGSIIRASKRGLSDSAKVLLFAASQIATNHRRRMRPLARSPNNARGPEASWARCATERIESNAPYLCQSAAEVKQRPWRAALLGATVTTAWTVPAARSVERRQETSRCKDSGERNPPAYDNPQRRRAGGGAPEVA
jgi:hypothetical protein